MKLSTILAPINEVLQANFDKPNKMKEYTNRGNGKIKTILEWTSNCEPSTFLDFKESKTKNFIDKNRIERFITDELEKKINKVRFSVSKSSHSLFTVSAYQLKVENIGLDKKYQEFADMFIYLSEFNIKTKNTVFGEVSSYDHNMGRPEQTKTISKIVLKKEFDIDIIERIKEIVINSYNREEKRKQLKLDKEQVFQNKLKDFGITQSQFNELKSLAQ